MRSRVVATLIVAVLSIGLFGGVVGAEPQPLTFTLDWRPQAPHAPFLLALQRGYFESEGLSVTIERGYGSADAIEQVATGVYDMGFGDFNTIIEHNVKNPDRPVIAVAIVETVSPYAIVTLKGRGIDAPEGLQGATIGAPAVDAARRLFPAFAEATGIDASGVAWVTLDADRREQRLVEGEVDAIAGFVTTIVPNLLALGVPDEEIVVFAYSDYGVELYGNAIVTTPAFLEANGDSVRAVLRAIVRGWQTALADSEAAIDALVAWDAEIDRSVEHTRWLLTVETVMRPDALEDGGFGAASEARLSRMIEVLVAAFALERVPGIAEVYTAELLPPLDDRRPPQ